MFVERKKKKKKKIAHNFFSHFAVHFVLVCAPSLKSGVLLKTDQKLSERELYDLKLEFSKVDRNGDGTIEVKELTAMLGKSIGDLDEVRGIIAQYDLNEDGVLNFNEFVRLVADNNITLKKK
jgi:Ca2+-binding EF-hand superfamily protein